MMNSEWFDVRGHRLHSRVWRKGPDAPVVVLVHGLLVSSRYLIPLANELAHNCNVYAIDLPGHGKSSRPGRALHVRELGQVVNEWLRVAHLDDVTVVANSYGSQVVTEALAQSTERVNSVVFMGPTVDARSPGVVRQSLMMAACLPFEPWWFLPVVFRDLYDCGIGRALKSVWRMSRHPMLERAVQIQVPAYVIRGRHDFVASELWTTALARATNAPSVQTIEHAGHIAHGKQPKAVAEYLRREVLANPARVVESTAV